MGDWTSFDARIYDASRVAEQCPLQRAVTALRTKDPSHGDAEQRSRSRRQSLATGSGIPDGAVGLMRTENPSHGDAEPRSRSRWQRLTTGGGTLDCLWNCCSRAQFQNPMEASCNTEQHRATPSMTTAALQRERSASHARNPSVPPWLRVSGVRFARHRRTQSRTDPQKLHCKQTQFAHTESGPGCTQLDPGSTCFTYSQLSRPSPAAARGQWESCAHPSSAC